MTEEVWQAVGSRLREIRREAGLTGRDLGAILGWHSSKISKIEYANRMPSIADIRGWCGACGVPDEAADLIASLRASEGAFREWRRLEQNGLRQVNQNIRPLEERTRNFRIYSVWNIPGPFQTADYVRAILKSLVERRGLVDDVEETVGIRMQRQQMLTRPDRTFAVLLEEAALRFPIGGAETMMGQLGHLVTVSTYTNVSLGIIPLGVDRSLTWPTESFFMFGDEQVTVELVANYLVVTKPADMALYARTFNDLSSLAVFGSKARRIITAAIDALDDEPTRPTGDAGRALPGRD